ncbi:MAG: ABC transporter permease [Bacteroidales bacterium]|jgi:peptide/nickel transport system permease protein|nr:ABC transporter permease [Bacteroidales bacterium]
MRKPKDYKSVSLAALTWQRFKKEKQGLVASGYILFVVITALLGYLITPDHTPYCNQQQLEIALRKPGFTVDILKVKSSHEVEKHRIFKRMLFGQPLPYHTMAIENHKFRNDTLFARLFEQEDEYGQACFPIADLYGEHPIETKKFRLGTDRYGRDVLSQLMIGSRISLAVGIISVFIALVIGILVGAVAGFYRGKVDDVLMFIINVVWSIPTLLLVIAISFALGKGFWQIFIAIGLTMWVDVARVVRGQVISLREQDYVEAGRALGFSDFHIIFKHILPNIVGSVIVISASNFSSAILMEAGLSFLGIGVQPPTPSWGMMMKENYAYIVLDQAYMAIIPGIAIMLLVLSFMLIGSALRNAMDVKR